MKYISIPILVVLIICSSAVMSQEMVTDRPDQTESSSTVAAGSFQIESGFLLGFSEEDKMTIRHIQAPSTLFRVGLTKGIELRVVTQLESFKNTAKDFTTNGISDLEVGTKFRLMRSNEHRNMEVAFLTHLILPTGTEKLSNGDFGTVNKLAISHALSDRLGLGYNVGYDYFGTGSGDFTYSVSLGMGVADKFSVYAEAYGAVVNLDDNQVNMDMGMTYLVVDNFQVDWSYGTGLNHNMNYMSIGVSWNIQQL